MKICCISDIHGVLVKKLPVADILIISGDLLSNYSRDKWRDAQNQRLVYYDNFLPWLRGVSSSYAHVVLIFGNHDRVFEYYQSELVKATNHGNIHLLVDNGVRLGGKLFWGSPWTTWFYGDHWSFNLPKNDGGKRAEEIYTQIPSDVDVLITHGPPHGILDGVPTPGTYTPGCFPMVTKKVEHVGCKVLLKHIGRVKPSLHVFGHIHEGYGRVEKDGVIHINASHHNDRFKPKNPPIVVEI